MRKRSNRRSSKSLQAWISMLLCMILLLPSGLALQAEESQETKEEAAEAAKTENEITKTIYIETAAEFLQFAEDCRLDTYSIGLQVELEDDIDLTGTEFTAIPTFSGVLNGNGHTISGVNLETDGSVQGLFRYVRAGAVVQDLHLEAAIAPRGSRSSVGSLAGENAGTIRNCSFNGMVSGNDCVGGLVGCNVLTGVIEACEVNGQIQGYHFVGGLAGENNGVIRECSNKAVINTTVQENAVSIGDISLDSVLGSESAMTVTDVGGIVGANMGVIRKCENHGNVGYDKIGYNMGGIAGSQSGYIVDCSNYGQICGRKEVGGIVGQMEPTLRMQFDEDTLQKLEAELDTMMGLAGQTMVSAQSSISGVNSQISAIEGYVKDAQSALEQISPGVTMPEDPELGNGTLDVPQVDVPDADAVLAAKNQLSSSLGQIPQSMNEMVSSATGTFGAISSSMQSLSNQMSVIGNTLKNADEHLGGSIIDASDADTSDDTSGKVETCVNYGPVSGDMNVGGIVGAMSYESSLDPELDVMVAGDLSLNFEGEVRAVVLTCKNEAVVTAHKQNGGGIAGRMNLGLVRDCQNRGTLQGTSYLGGITGRGDGGYIRESNTRCLVNGNEYLGGIAGTAEVVSDCLSITKFSGGSEKTGGVLGSTDDINEDISGNFYLPIENDIGGIDGISYEGSAQAMGQKQFFALDQLPEDFQIVTVRFVFDDGTETMVMLDYGEVLKAEKIPALPEKDTGSGRWEGLEELDTSALYFDVTLRATYDPYEKVIAAEALRADGRPILLAGSEFGKDARLEIEELANGPVSVSDDEITLEAWSILMTGAGETAKLRYLPPDEYAAEVLLEDEARIMVKDLAGVWREVSYTVDGSYIIFEIGMQDAGFCLIRQEQSSWMLYGAIGVGLFVLIEGYILLRIRSTKRKQE